MKYLIVRSQDSYYFTGEGTLNGEAGLGTWSPFPKFAKTYTKRAWAERAAQKWSGTVVALEPALSTPREVKQQ